MAKKEDVTYPKLTSDHPRWDEFRAWVKSYNEAFEFAVKRSGADVSEDHALTFFTAFSCGAAWAMEKAGETEFAARLIAATSRTSLRFVSKKFGVAQDEVRNVLKKMKAAKNQTERNAIADSVAEIITQGPGSGPPSDLLFDRGA